MDNLQPYKISLDFYIRKIITVNAKQLDDKSRIINITCTENGKKFFVDSSTTSAFVRYKKSDGYAVLNQIDILSDGTVNLELTQQMLAVEGRHLVDIMLINKSELEVYTSSISVEDDDNGNVTVIEKHTTNVSDISVEEILNAISENGISVLSTMSFYINTEGVAIDGAEIESSYEYNALIEGLGKMVAVDYRLVELEQNVVDSVVKCNNATDSANQATLSANQAALSANQAALKAQLATQNANAVVSTKADSIVSTSSGEVVTTTDSANAKPKNIKLFGKGTQRQFEGNQLLDTTIQYVSDGVSFEGNGATLHVSGTTEALGYGSIKEFGNLFCFENGEKYSISRKETNMHAGFWFYNSGGSLIGTLSTERANQYSLTIPTDAVRVKMFYTGLTVGTKYDFEQRIMVNKGEPKEWEPFVGGEQSPSINYPQIPVFHGEGGSIEGKVLTSNRFDVNKALETFLDANGRMYFKFINGETYTMSVDSKIADTSMNTLFCVSSNTWKNGVLADSRLYLTSVGRLTKTFTIPNDGLEYYLTPAVSGVPILEFHSLFDGRCSENLQIELGEATTPYTPYTEQPFTALTPNGLKGIPLGTTIPDAIKNSPIHMSGVYWDKAEGQYYIADTKNENGKDVQRIFKMRLLAEQVYIIDTLCNEESNYFYIRVSPYLTGINNGFLCDVARYESGYVINGADSTVSGAYIDPISTGYLYMRVNKKSGVTTLDEIKEYLTNNEVYITLILPDPIITDPTAEELDQYNSLVMNYPITNVVNDAGAFQEVTYIADTKNYISKIEKKHEEDIQTLKNAILSLGGNV